MDLFLVILALVWLVVASLEDIKKTEIYNWISFSLIVFALLYRAIFSILFSEPLFFFFGFLGLLVFSLVSLLLYYARFFAGGDMRLFMALGAIIPFSFSFIKNIRLSLSFFLILFLVAFVYSFVYSFFMIKKGFFSSVKENYVKNRGLINISLVACLGFLILGLFFEVLFLALSLLLFIFPVLFLYTKAVEHGMFKEVRGRDLIEGDWLVEDVKIKGKTIKANWDGLSKKDIKLLKGKKVKIKTGIPFVPVFLISFILFVIGLVYYAPLVEFGLF